MDDKIEIVNIVGSGSLQREIDPEVLANELNFPLVSYDANLGGVFIRFVKDGPLTCIYRSGKFVVRGAKNYQVINETLDSLYSILSERGINAGKSDFEIRNVVCVSDFNTEVNLNQLAVEIGLEKAEFEPEQFPGLIYRSENWSPISLVFSSGKVVITGSSDETEIEALVEEIRKFEPINDI